MDGFKDFVAKDIDSAIAAACDFYDSPREKLEIELIQDAKSGIFGIVGARKAKIRARRAQLRTTVENLLGKMDAQAGSNDSQKSQGVKEHTPKKGQMQQAEPSACEKYADLAQERSEAKPPRRKQGAQKPLQAPGRRTERKTDATHKGAYDAPKPRPAGKARPGSVEEDLSLENDFYPEAGLGLSQQPGADVHPGASQLKPAEAKGHFAQENDLADHDAEDESQPHKELDAAELKRLEDLAGETLAKLLRPIAPDARLKVQADQGRVCVHIQWSGDAGLLIGREGQNLASLQYLASRIISRAMNTSVRVQLDVGDYRRKQEEKLREMALALAAKAKASGRTYSTRPLSSYHRRIVHLALQEQAGIQTQSNGEGALKRVLISPNGPGRA